MRKSDNDTFGGSLKKKNTTPGSFAIPVSPKLPLPNFFFYSLNPSILFFFFILRSDHRYTLKIFFKKKNANKMITQLIGPKQ